MLTIRDLSKEVDMTAVRGGNAHGWQGCGDEDSEGRRHDHRDGDRDGRDRERCEPHQRFDSAAPVASFNLGLNGSNGQ